MGSKKSSSSTTIKNSDKSLKEQQKQNKQLMEMFKSQNQIQMDLFKQQMEQVNSLNAGVISGQRTTLSDQQQALRNQEMLNRAAGQQSYNDGKAALSTQLQNQRLQDKQNNFAQNQSAMNAGLTDMERENFISQFIRRYRTLQGA